MADTSWFEWSWQPGSVLDDASQPAWIYPLFDPAYTVMESPPRHRTSPPTGPKLPHHTPMCFRFFDLPRELRDNIYGLLVHDVERHLVKPRKGKPARDRIELGDFWYAHARELNRQITQEYTDAVFKNARLAVYLQADVFSSGLSPLLANMPDNLRQLRGLTLEIDAEDVCQSKSQPMPEEPQAGNQTDTSSQ